MENVRWKQRYTNFSNMLRILTESLQQKELDTFSELEQIGLAKSFELCFELFWKLLKDYLEHEEIEIGLISPKNVLRAAATCGLLEQIGADGDVLMLAHQSRNELVHIYDHEKFRNALGKVTSAYLPEIQKANCYFSTLVNADE